MFRWIPFPFLRFLIFYISGYLLARTNIFHLPEVIFTGVAFGIFSFLLLNLRRRLFKYTRRYSGPVVLILFLLMGVFRYQILESENISNRKIWENAKACLVKLDSEPGFAVRSQRIGASLIKIQSQGQWQTMEGKIQLNILSPKEFSYGDICLIYGVPQRIYPKGNPGTFDYGNWLMKKGFRYQAFIDSLEIINLGPAENKSLLIWIHKLRKEIRSLITRSITNPEVSGVLFALVLGDKSTLDPDIRTAYANTGAMHVLAVSGLHVGLVYLMISYLFGFIRKLRNGPFLFILISVFLLSLYALLTGLSPSVLRASFMFSLVLIGKGLGRKSTVYNSIAVSAFVLLLIDPELIYSLSFQLSYLAVTGIVYFFPLIYRLIQPKYWLVDKIWSVTTVSLAAQWSTFPLIIFHFNQFPLYGVLSNLLVIPGAVLILFFSFLSLIITAVFPSFDGMMHLLEQIVNTVNQCIFLIDSIPNSVLEVNQISGIQLVILLCFIGSVAVTLFYRSALWVIISVLLIISFNIYPLYSIVANRDKEYLVINNVWPYTRMEFISDTNPLVYQSPGFDTLKSAELSLGAIGKIGLGRVPTMHQFKNGSMEFIQWRDYKIGVINSVPELRYDSLKIELDILLLAGRSINDVQQFLPHFAFDTMIVDGSCSKYAVQTLNLPNAYKIPLKGAYLVEL